MSFRLLLTAGSSILLLAAGGGRLLLTLLSCRDGAGCCLFWRDAFGRWLASGIGLKFLLMPRVSQSDFPTPPAAAPLRLPAAHAFGASADATHLPLDLLARLLS